MDGEADAQLVDGLEYHAEFHVYTIAPYMFVTVEGESSVASCYFHLSTVVIGIMPLSIPSP